MCLTCAHHLDFGGPSVYINNQPPKLTNHLTFAPECHSSLITIFEEGDRGYNISRKQTKLCLAYPVVSACWVWQYTLQYL